MERELNGTLQEANEDIFNFIMKKLGLIKELNLGLSTLEKEDLILVRILSSIQEKLQTKKLESTTK